MRRLWLASLLPLLTMPACSKHDAVPATNERTATEAAAVKAVNDTDAALRDAAAPLPEPASPRRQDAVAQKPLVEPH